DKSGLASELESTKTLSERERIKLEQELNAKTVELESQRGELSSLQEKIDALTAAAERDKSGLASELESTKTLSERERSKLEQELNAKTVELESQRGELSSLQEKIDALTAAAEREKSGLASELESTKILSEKERGKLEQELNAKTVELESQRGELSSLQEKIDALTAAAEKDKSGLASELAAAIIAAGTIKSELSTLKAETAGERKERLAALKNLEKENAKLCKSRESAEATLAKQTEQIATLKATLNEKNKEVISAAGEVKKAGKVAKELEALKSELESTRSAREAADLREKASLGELEETNRRVNALDIQLKSNAAENERLRESLETQTTLAASGRAEAERLSLELEKISAESSAKSAEEVAKLQEEIAVLNTRVNETSVEISRTNKQLEEAQRLVGSSEIERASLRSELAELLSSGTNAVREASEVRARLKILEAEHLEVQEQLKSQITALQAAKAEANDLRVDLRKNKESSEQSLGEIEKTLKSRIAELESSLGSERVRAGDLLSQNEEHKSNLVNLGKNLDTLREEADQLKTRNEETSRNNGRLQAELNRESAERAQISEELETARTRSNQLVKEVEDLKQSLSGKDREMAEREQHYSRSESDMVQKLKRELGESVTARDASEEKAAKAIKEKLSLSSAFERLKEQFDQAESANRKAKEVEEEMNHSKGLLARRLEKAEASNSELAARIKEESMALIASRTLIAKLETELRENESEAVRREHEQVVTLQADISQRQRKSAEAERLRSQLEGELNLTKEAKRQADERILALSERILEMESETLSTRNLLTDTEKKRGELSSRLAEESALAESHAKAVESLRTDLADTIARFKSSEAELLSKHANETDELLAELRSERGHKEGLEVELSNTRIGMSEALRKAREESAAAQAKLIADGNAKLSAAEDNLSEVIRSREEIELSRNGLEDELNLRDGQIEKLSERIEDLEIHLRDEIEARHKVLKDFQTTKEGFSKALHANWNHLGSARSTLDKEKTFRGESEAALTTAKEEIARLIATAKEQDQRYHSELRDWEQRYETLREEKLTLASEDANLNKIREQILEATTKKKTIDAELSSLSSGMKDFQLRHRELQAQKDALLREREELKAGLNVARSELDSVQMRCNESKDQESKLTDTITAAERRIQSLRKLESEMEQAVERKRQQNILSRGDVFSGQVEALTTSGDFSREDFYRKLITKLDLLDDLTKRYDNKWRYPKVAEQLAILKRSFVDFLHDHSVKQFDLEPGTVLSVAERKRIKLVPLQNGAPKNPVTNGKGSTSHNSLVVETLRPGYVYQDGSKDVIIRKAEVVVS
ncbi:MAG: hypothetical protein KA152_05450, partial [Verrucomicrobiales bacterium]|nr:hypothetical protein [Verrucomicrobiales bacterium]